MTGKTPALDAKRARYSTSRVVMVAAVLLTALSYSAVNQAQVGGGKPRPSKLDRVLQKAAARADDAEQRVILRARPGRASALADRLTQHGDRVAAKHARLNSITAVVHGTHVATLIAGEGKDSETDVDVIDHGKSHRTKVAIYRGVAPKARIISLKVLDRNGVGYTSSVLNALEFAIVNRDKLKIDIINLSLGHPIYESPATDPLVRAVEDAVRAGIVVVASAGNYGINQETGEVGYGGITSPGNAPSAITVGALDIRDTIDRADDA